MKKGTSHNIEWENISKFLSGEMNEEERIAFEKLIDSNPEYAKIVAASENDLNLIHEANKIQNSFNIDSAWSSVKSRLKTTEQTNKETPVIPILRWKKFVQVAAMLIITIGIGFASYQVYIDKIAPYQSIASQLNETGKSITLADGSKITLNGESKLVFPREFKGNERRVQLTGEAFFDIAKNPESPFIISVNNAEVKVLGTSFNIKASNDQVEVLVETGKVQFSITKEPGKHLILKKGDFGVLQKNELEKVAMRDENYLSWKTQKMVFKNTYLGEVAKVIDRTYHVEIQFQDTGIMKLPIHTTFNQTPLDEVLENLCLPFNLTYKKSGNQIIIKKRLE